MRQLFISFTLSLSAFWASSAYANCCQSSSSGPVIIAPQASAYAPVHTQLHSGVTIYRPAALLNVQQAQINAARNAQIKRDEAMAAQKSEDTARLDRRFAAIEANQTLLLERTNQLQAQSKDPILRPRRYYSFGRTSLFGKADLVGGRYNLGRFRPLGTQASITVSH